ncbi:MAG: SAM-dependent methyltransferase [Flavobacteriales bacterium]|jgi:SAM-dependent methyltransferase
MKDYKEINRQSWNNRTEIHVDSDFYDVEGFLAGKSSLNSIELEMLGNLEGKKVLHLQCHFGQDSISLARMGAQVTAVDLSDVAIEKGKTLAEKAGVDVRFICCDVYSLLEHLDDSFDLIFTTYGVVGWLPDMDRWAKLISNYLKPQGQLVFVEFHPAVWMFDDDFEGIKYSYFNTGFIQETESGTYTDFDNSLTQDYVMWNHGMSEVVNALISNGINIKSLDEFDYSPYNCFKGTVEFEPGKFRIEKMGGKLPMVYAILGEKQ